MIEIIIVITIILLLWVTFDFNIYIFALITYINVFLIFLLENNFNSKYLKKSNNLNKSNNIIYGDGIIGGSDLRIKQPDLRIKQHKINENFHKLPQYVQDMLLTDKFSMSHTIEDDSKYAFSRILTDDSPRLEYNLPTPRNSI